MTKGKIRNRRVVGDGGGGGVPGERGLNRCYYYLLHGSSSLVRTKFLVYSKYLTIIPQARVVHELSTHYDKSEWNNCFIIYALFKLRFVFSGVAFSRRATISASVGSANLAAILDFTTHRI